MTDKELVIQVSNRFQEMAATLLDIRERILNELEKADDLVLTPEDRQFYLQFDAQMYAAQMQYQALLGEMAHGE